MPRFLILLLSLGFALEVRIAIFSKATATIAAKKKKKKDDGTSFILKTCSSHFSEIQINWVSPICVAALHENDQ